MKNQSAHSCPSPADLNVIFDESSNEESRQVICKHVESCPKCQSICESILEQMSSAVHPTMTSLQTQELRIQNIVDAVKLRVASSLEHGGSGDTLPTDDLSGFPEFGSEFRVTKRLGSGSQGVVYLARDLQLDRDVVIKTLHRGTLATPVAQQRFKREARAAASVQGDFVVPIHRIGVLDDQSIFLVMDFIDGSTLRDFQRDNGPFAFRECAEFSKQIALGLEAVHSQGIVHRDIKPENILIESRTKRAKLTDFGLAVDTMAESRITSEGVVAGTPAYMSPEQVVAPQSVDARTDIYSLGVILYELLTGEVPFRGTARMTMMQLVHEEPTRPRFYNDLIPIDLETICLRAIAKEPGKRFATASQFVAEIDRFLNGQTIESRPVGRIERCWRLVKKNPIVSLLTVTSVLLMTTLAATATVSSVRLSRLNRQVSSSALQATSQRDAALETLSQLIFELQQKFDKESIDIDEVQKDTLQIALRGMERVQTIAGPSSSQGFASAVALRRLGQTFHNLEDDEAAQECLSNAETSLKSILEKKPYDDQVLLEYMETAFVIDDCLIDDEVADTMSRYEFCIQACRNVTGWTTSPKISVKLAQAQARIAVLLMEEDQLTEASSQLKEAASIIEKHRMVTPLANAPDLLGAFVHTESAFVEILTLQGKLAEMKQRAKEGLLTLNQLPEDQQQLSEVIACKLSLYERLGFLDEDSVSSDLPSNLLKSFQQFREELMSGSASDDWHFSIGTSTAAILSSGRLALDLNDSAKAFLKFRIALCNKRLEHVVDDPDCLIELLDSYAALADIEAEASNRNEASRWAILGLESTKKLVDREAFSDIEWLSACDCLELLQGTSTEEAKSKSTSWAKTMNGWTEQESIQQSMTNKELKRCRRIVRQSLDNNGEA